MQMKKKENFCFLGIKDNPYTYMQQCDIYVQPSRFEGYCTTTNEARIIGCPIVMTNVSGAEEQISDGITGYIVDTTGEAIFEGIKRMIDNPEIREKMIKNIKNINADTTSEMDKLYVFVKVEDK